MELNKLRKLHNFGGYSLLVCLPAQWLHDNITGDYVEVIEDGDKLVIKDAGHITKARQKN